MAAIKNTQYILDAIDQLRRRKARPDRKRICNFVCRRYMVNMRDIIADLERLVDEEIVIKVEYKGNISYRNAAKWAKLSVHKSRIEIELNDLNQLERLQSETERMSYALRSALSELIVKDPDYLDIGVPVFELEQFLREKDTEFFARISFNVLLNREARAGTVVKLPNGNYSLGQQVTTAASTPSPSPSLSPSGSDETGTGTHNGDDSATKESLARPQSHLRWIPIGGSASDRFVSGSLAMDSKSSPSPSSQPWANSKQDQDLELDPEPDPEPEPTPTVSPASSPIPAFSQPDPSPDELDQEIEPEPENEAGGSTATSAAADASNAESAENAESGGYRAGERRKRAKKKVFDPSDNNIPKVKKRGRPSNSVKSGVSSSYEENGNKEKPEPAPSITGPLCALCNSEIKEAKFTSCRDCTKKAHSTCIAKSLKSVSAKAKTTPWQCVLCKSCQACSQTKESGTMALCSSCDDGYHVKCIVPKPKLPWKKWLCERCSPPEPKSAATTPDGSPVRGRGPPVLVPMVPVANASAPAGADMYTDLNDYSIDESIPDATEWTSEEVFHYFNNIFPDHAAVFKEQDIDGGSLLLMKRSDVINGLSLKLGPALKIYGQVKRLQLRRSERHLLWE